MRLIFLPRSLCFSAIKFFTMEDLLIHTTQFRILDHWDIVWMTPNSPSNSLISSATTVTHLLPGLRILSALTAFIHIVECDSDIVVLRNTRSPITGYGHFDMLASSAIRFFFSTSYQAGRRVPDSTSLEGGV